MHSNQIYGLKELADRYHVGPAVDEFLKQWELRDLSIGTYESYKRMRNAICYRNVQSALTEIKRYPFKKECLAEAISNKEVIEDDTSIIR